MNRMPLVAEHLFLTVWSFATFWPFAISHIFLRPQKFRRSAQKTKSTGLAVGASRGRISTPASIDFLSDYLPRLPMLRLKLESDEFFSVLAADIFWQFAGLPSWQFGLSEGRSRPDKRPVNIDTNQTAASLAEYRSDASPPIFVEF
jgi:hypothetical protein